MERGSKRKSAGLSASSPSEGRAAKKQKTPEPEPSTPAPVGKLKLKATTPATTQNNAPTPASKRRAGATITNETAETTTETGLKFLDHLKNNARDKNGHLIATAFLELPDKEELPEYYEHTKLPVSIGTMEDKLKRGEYPSLRELESDFKRMIINAKSFNDSKSDIYLDAERVRKMVSNFMIKNNPAYMDKSYVAIPTPIPDDPVQSNGVDEVKSIPLVRTKSGSKPTQSQTAEDLQMSEADAQAVKEEEPGAKEGINGTTDTANGQDSEHVNDYEGLSFQEAQDKIVTEMIENEDDGGLKIFTPFRNLPARSLTDYYAHIKEPMCLNLIRKKVRGVHGRDEPTGVTALKTWDTFEAEFAKIWNNAREYNMDGSDMYVLAGELEDYFREQLTKAKRVVKGPESTKLTLSMNKGKKTSVPAEHHSTGLKVRLGARRDSDTPARANESATPAPASTHTTPGPPGISIDQKALSRQKEDVQAGLNGAHNASSTTMQKIDVTEEQIKESSGSTSQVSPVAEGVTTNGKATSRNESPESSASRPASSSNQPSSASSEAVHGNGQIDPQFKKPSLPPPSAHARSKISQSPTPSSQIQDPIQTWNQNHPPLGSIDSRFRAPGKTAADALISTIHIRSHPELPIAAEDHVTYDLFPHPTQQEYSFAFTLPAQYQTLQIQPKISSSLDYDVSANPTLSVVQSLQARHQRPYRLFVLINGVAAQPLQTQSPSHQNAVPRIISSSTETTFNVRLTEGMNTITIECVTTTTDSLPPTSTTNGSPNPRDQLVHERIDCYVHLLNFPN